MGKRYRCILFLITLLFFYKAGKTQQFGAGIQLGINSSQVDGDGYGGFDKAGLYAGAYAYHAFSDKFELQFEINYVNKGSRKLSHPDKGDYDYFLAKLNYVEIPLSFKYNYSEKLSFEAGPYYGRLLYSYLEDEYGTLPKQGVPFKNYDIGGFAGLFYHFNNHFSAHVRSSSSFLPIRDLIGANRNIGLYNKLFNRGWYNICLAFVVEYKFNFKNK